MFEGWTLGGYAQLGANDNRITQIDFIRSDRLPEAMDVVRHPTTNELVCRASFFDPARYGNCVPINLLGVGRASQAAIDYVLTGDQYILAKTDQNVVEFSMEGDIGDGWGAGAISLAFGGGWREESIDQTLGPDDIIARSMPLTNAANAAVREQHRGPAESAGGLHAASAACRRSSRPRRTRSSSSRTCSRSRASTRSRKCSSRRCCRSSRASPASSSSISTSRRVTRTTKAPAASGRGRPASTGRSTTPCGCARRCRATFVRRRCRSGSTAKASAAPSTTRRSAA